VAAKPPILRHKDPQDEELTKWRDFSRQMTAAYEDMKTKYQASVTARDSDAKLIAALQEQIKSLKMLLMKTHRDKEDLGLLAKQAEETQRRGSSKAESNIECSYLAELIINLRTDLDKAHSDVVKLRR
jgi:predicted RNase H-like nuclease (RuvC/YqgF family)